MKTEEIAELKAILDMIENANESFHTMKNLRVWASEENRGLKLLIRKQVEDAKKILSQ